MSGKGIRLALIGATSLAGESVLAQLDESGLSPTELFLLDDEGAGGRLQYRSGYLPVEEISGFDFTRADVAIFAASPSVSASYATVASDKGCFVVDCSGHFRGDSAVPMVVATVNPQLIDAAVNYGIIALPGSMATQLVSTLKPVHERYGLLQVSVTVLAAVSELGRGGVEELSSQAVSLLNMREVKHHHFSQQVVFNLIPSLGEIGEDGASGIERELVEDTKSLLGDTGIAMNVTVAVAPVFFGHSMSIVLETRDPVSAGDITALFEDEDGVAVVEQPSAVESAANDGNLYIGRIRAVSGGKSLLSLWSVADNLRFGVADSAIRVTKILEKDYM